MKCLPMRLRRKWDSSRSLRSLSRRRKPPKKRSGRLPAGRAGGERVEPKVHAFLYVAAEQALQKAAAADQHPGTDEGRRPLQGIPIAVKDVLSVAGMPCTCGSEIPQGDTP